MVPRIGTSLLLLAAIALAQHAVAQITPLAPATHSSNYSAMAIVKVEMAGSSRTSGYTSPPAYNDYTGQAPFELTPGDSYQIKVTRGSYSSVKRHAFIDWNNDGDFDDANEEIGTDGTSSSNTILDWVKSFTCPVGTPAGLKRMRVRLHYYYYSYNSYQSYFTPYYNTLYGETEDYAVEVLGTTPPVMTPKTLKSTYANVAFEDYVEATDGKAPYTYAINKISNASWVNLDENTGKVFGNPGSLDGGTTAVFEITATDDSNLTSDPVQYTVTVNNPLSLPYTDDMSGAKIANYLLKSGTGAYMDIRPEAGETGTGLLLAGSGTGSWPLSPASNQANLDVLNNPAKWAGGASPDASAFNSQATFYVSAPVLNRLAVQFDYKITNDALLADAEYFTNFVIEYTEDGKNWLRGVGQNANAQNFYRDETSSFVRENSILNLSGTQTQVGVRISALVRNRYNTSDKTFISIDNLNVFVPVQILTSGELPSAQETVPYPPVILDLFGGMQPYTVDFDPANAPPASYNLMVEYDNDLAAWVLRSPANLGPNVGSTGLHSFKILANDANNVPQSKTFSLAINPVPSPLTFTTTALPSTAVDTLYSQQVSVSGGVPIVGPNPYLFSITSTSAGWMSINANTGTISGMVPAADLGVTHQVTVRVEDRIGSSKEATFSIAVVDSLEVTTLSPTVAEVASSYAFKLVAGGGTAPYVWEYLSGSRPIGISLNPVTGELKGVPYIGQEGTHEFVVRVSDAGTQSAEATISMTVNPKSVNNLTITSSNNEISNISANSNVDSYLRAAGGTPPYSWSLLSNNLPTGMSLQADGTLAGSPVSGAEGRYVLKFRVLDALGDVSVQNFTIDVAPEYFAPEIDTLQVLPSGVEGVNYLLLLEVSKGQAPYTWSVISGGLPQGLTLNTSGGSITGTPTANTAGNYNVTIRVQDAAMGSATLEATITVDENQNSNGFQVLTSNADLGQASSLGQHYSKLLSVQGGVPPLTWTIAGGSLPTGMQLASYGGLYGTPAGNSAGNYSFIVQVSDSIGNTAQSTLSLTVVESSVDDGSSNVGPIIGIEALPQASGSGGCSTQSGTNVAILAALLMLTAAVIRRRRTA